MRLDWMLICYKDNTDGSMDVIHLCAYEEEPGMIDIKSLREELATDPEFEMIGDTDYKMKMVNRKEHLKWFESFGIPEESGEMEY